MTATTHTPTPWQVFAHDAIAAGPTLGTIIFQARNLERFPANANAAFIVTACNAHDELVAALRELIDHAHHPDSSKARARLEQAEAALAKVQA